VAEVLVTDRSALFGSDWPQGFLPLDPRAGGRLLAAAASQARFVDRPTAEANPAWKQWIPYCVLRQISTPATQAAAPAVSHVFCVRRTRGQSETRLHGAYSLGLGGHIEPADGSPTATDPDSYFTGALLRELHEELILEPARIPAPRLVGLLNDDSTPVGRVHAGLVYVLDLPAGRPQTTAVGIREISKMAGGWGSLAELRILWQDPQQFETWSQRIVEAGIAGSIGT
jgi:predicted NUDIX family phosphoesterase